MLLSDFLEQKKIMEGNIKLAVEQNVKKFQDNTEFCPGKVEVEMLDVTKQNLSQGARKWMEKKMFIVGEVRTTIEI